MNSTMLHSNPYVNTFYIVFCILYTKHRIPNAQSNDHNAKSIIIICLSKWVSRCLAFFFICFVVLILRLVSSFNRTDIKTNEATKKKKNINEYAIRERLSIRQELRRLQIDEYRNKRGQTSHTFLYALHYVLISFI